MVNHIISFRTSPTVDPPSTADSGDIFHTTNTSVQLALLYDQDYNISVVARNCIGSSAPAEIHIRITIIDNNCTLVLQGEMTIINSCLSSVTATTMDEAMMRNFTTDFTLDLSTTWFEHTCHNYSRIAMSSYDLLSQAPLIPWSHR